MSRRNHLVGLSFGCAMLMAIGMGEAQQRVLPTGTPTILPRKAVATPTPPPPSDVEVEAKNLGAELSRIDEATWEIVRTSWRNDTLCLEAVDAHLGEALGELKRLIRTSKVMECAEDPDSNRMRLRLTTEEARRAFLGDYGDAVAALRSLRESFADEPAAIRVLDAARQRQADWQDLACRELASERLKRAPGRAKEVPVSSGSKRGIS